LYSFDPLVFVVMPRRRAHALPAPGLSDPKAPPGLEDMCLEDPAGTATSEEMVAIRSAVVACVAEHQKLTNGSCLQLATLGNRLPLSIRRLVHDRNLRLSQIAHSTTGLVVSRNADGRYMLAASSEAFESRVSEIPCALQSDIRRGVLVTELQRGVNVAGDNLRLALQDVATALTLAGRNSDSCTLRMTGIGNKVTPRTRHFLNVYKTRLSGIVQCFPEYFSLWSDGGMQMLTLIAPLGVRQFDAEHFRLSGASASKPAVRSEDGGACSTCSDPDDRSCSSFDGESRSESIDDEQTTGKEEWLQLRRALVLMELAGRIQG